MSNKTGEEGNEGGGGESKGGRTATMMAKEEEQQLRQEYFDVVQLEFDTIRTKPEGKKRKDGSEKKRARAGWCLGKHGEMGVSDTSRYEYLRSARRRL